MNADLAASEAAKLQCKRPVLARRPCAHAHRDSIAKHPCVVNVASLVFAPTLAQYAEQGSPRGERTYRGSRPDTTFLPGGPPKSCLRQPGAPEATSVFPRGFKKIFSRHGPLTSINSVLSDPQQPHMRTTLAYLWRTHTQIRNSTRENYRKRIEK
jgi:hypothetical protein